MSFSLDPAVFDEFCNLAVGIYSEATASVNGRGAPVPGALVAVHTEVPAQEWPLTESDKAGLSGEEITLRSKLRLNRYFEDITPKMWVVWGNIRHNIVLVSDDGAQTCTILTLRRVTG